MGRNLLKNITLLEIAKTLGLAPPTENIQISSVSKTDELVSGGLSFATNGSWAIHAPENTGLIVSSNITTIIKSIKLLSTEPRYDFVRALNFLDKEIGFSWNQKDPVVDSSARIGRNVVLGKGVIIGANTVIYNNVVIGDEVHIGSGCLIKSGAIIGEEGFGFARDAEGKAVRFLHIGNVLIGNNVEVGSLTTVCRGTLGNTVIDDGVKIDDHVHIGHNAQIGSDALITACAEIGAGVIVGKRAWIAPHTSIKEDLTIGDDAFVGLGAVIIRDVDVNTVVVGNPARQLIKRKVNT